MVRPGLAEVDQGVPQFRERVLGRADLADVAVTDPADAGSGHFGSQVAVLIGAGQIVVVTITAPISGAG